MPGDVASPWAGAAMPLSDDTAFLKLIDEANDTTLNLAVGDLTVMPLAKPPDGHYIAGGYMFGRRSNANGLLPFTSRVLSRSHIQLLIDTEGAVWAVDLKSLHGTAIERKSATLTSKNRTVTLKPHVPMRLEHDDVLIFGKPVSANDGVQHLPLRVLVHYYHEPAKADYPATPTFADSPASIKMPGYLHRGYGVPVMYESEQEDADTDARDGDSVVCLGDSPRQRARASIEIIEVRDSPATEPEPSRHNTPKANLIDVSLPRAEAPRQLQFEDPGSLQFDHPGSLHFEAPGALHFEVARGVIDFELPAFPDDDVFNLRSSPAADLFVDHEGEEDDMDVYDDEEDVPPLAVLGRDYSSSDDDEVSSENSFGDSEHDSSEHAESDDEAISADESDRHSELSVDEEGRFWRTEHLFSFSHPSVISEAPRAPEIEEEVSAAFVKSSVPEENDDEEASVEEAHSHEHAMPVDDDDGVHGYVFEAEPEADARSEAYASEGEERDGHIPYSGMGSPMSYSSPRTPSRSTCSPAYSESSAGERSRSASPAVSAALSVSPVLSDAERARTRSPDAPYIPGWAINRGANAANAAPPSSEPNEAHEAEMQSHIDHFFNTITFDHDNESPMPSAIEGTTPFGCSLPPSPPLSSGGDGVDRGETQETRSSEFKSVSTAPLTPPSPARNVSLPSRVAQVVEDKVMDKDTDKGVVDKGVATVVPAATTTPSRKRKRDDDDEPDTARPAQAPRTLSFLKGIAVGVGLGASLTFGALYQLGAE